MNLKMSYFIGNILSPTIGQPEAHDPTFAFTRKESNNLDLTNCPIRMEHDENMQVGKVLRSWNDHNGSKWIIGKLNQKTYMDRFANHAINKDPLTNTTYYTGLSLQHEHITHKASGKSHKKKFMKFHYVSIQEEMIVELLWWRACLIYTNQKN